MNAVFKYRQWLPLVAVIRPGAFNVLGVMLSSGAVAYAIVTLRPVERIRQVGWGAGYAMIFALMLAAIVGNLGTRAFGLPNSSSHALIGAVLGVGLAKQPMSSGDGTAGVAGTLAANGSGLQASAGRNMALARIMTRPAAIRLAVTLFFIFRRVFSRGRAGCRAPPRLSGTRGRRPDLLRRPPTPQ